VAIYIVGIGRIRLTMYVLNLDVNSGGSAECIGKGTYGAILIKNVASVEFVAKLQFRQPIKHNIEDVLREVAISKVCSLFGIGPAVKTDIPYDLVVYNDGIQFHLERCLPLSECQLLQMNTIASDLKYCLSVLHSLRIVHKDIKPQNVLWSQHYNRFVLCDFGISHYVKESIGQKTETGYEGTYGYEGAEMRSLYEK
jgi:serine/threonine protein kinase